MGGQRERSRVSRVLPRPRGIDRPLIIYGLVTGVLAVGAGTLTLRGTGRLGTLGVTLSVLVTVALVVIAVITAEPILRWIVPVRGRTIVATGAAAARGDRADHGQSGREHRDPLDGVELDQQHDARGRQHRDNQ